jgi:hypothetical protein
MIVARHRERDLCFVEAYEAGVGVPLIRYPDGAWELDAVDPGELWDDYVDVEDPSERRDLIAEARRASRFFEVRLGDVGLDSLTVAEMREALARSGGVVLEAAELGTRAAPVRAGP